MPFPKLAWADFHSDLTCFARSAIHEKKNTVRLQGEKFYLFYPARTGINFPYFQLAGRSFRFPCQLISQSFISQLTQILPDERVFCRAAPLGTSSNFTFSMEKVNKQQRNSTFLSFFYCPLEFNFRRVRLYLNKVSG